MPVGRFHPTHRRRSFRQNSAINVTPLVDVMLVLLIIFMVTAPMMTVGVKVDLPQTGAAEMNDPVEPLVVSIDARGQLYVQEALVPFSELTNKLAAIIGRNKDARVYVRADKTLPYATVMAVMGVIAESGLSKVSLLAETPKKAANRRAR